MKTFHQYLENRMPFGVRMDQQEDEGYDLQFLIKALTRYVQEAVRKWQQIIPQMEVFEHHPEYSYNFDLVDRMSYARRNIEGLIEDMIGFWIKSFSRVKDVCELGRYVPKLMNNVAGGSLTQHAERLKGYQEQSEEGRQLYQKAIEVIERLETNMKQVTDRLQTYCAK
jgi:hypothetical protein